ncbi:MULTISPECIES: hypothetical protein [Protofrankia]|uniref:hypothetical protein n=1 Tax=Protofrankia TaxID=2994361 RepID=UPI000AB3B65A|nr:MULTISPECIES: hypothetical protein [Protofrankia]
MQRPLAEAYLSAWVPGSVPRPRIAVIRAVFPAGDREAAAADLDPALQLVFRAFARGGFAEDVPRTRDEAISRLNVHLGRPEEIVTSLRADPALLEFADYVVPVVSHEASTLDADLRRLESVAREIAPALGWHPAGSAVAAESS